MCLQFSKNSVDVSNVVLVGEVGWQWIKVSTNNDVAFSEEIFNFEECLLEETEGCLGTAENVDDFDASASARSELHVLVSIQKLLSAFRRNCESWIILLENHGSIRQFSDR